ncbi:PrsW family intramembrane metalloprotease [Phaeodactylibacter luteus]|uniref:Protease PrsW n=1 Tax=Phaeodactylibacter luteus TaxID=1564516 RepID=A0A5C6RG46_9BACT|nr:PrsW family glutamic-type intramembrane protease [Phaeodactylibacter luteus]TXB59435.1 PrsW family intramembrane metalloprotease [Phaeodactylibacter luteus]
MELRTVLLLLAALAPGVLICWYIYQMDKYEKEAPLPLVLSATLGAVVTYPVLKLETWATEVELHSNASLIATLFSSFIVVSLTEELIKFLALIAYPYRSRFFNEPMDGIVYSIMIGMGFATAENLLYAFQYGMETTILRAFTAVPAHAAFAVMMGYFAGQAKFAERPVRRRNSLLLMFLVPWGVHGVYDFFILQQAYENLVILALVVLGISLLLSWELLTEQQDNSPFK